MTRQLVPSRTRRARVLRARLTEAEKYLWSRVRSRELGCRIRRQVPISPYVVDFLCARHRLVIELDGEQHYLSAHDRRRDAWLEAQGYRVVRFKNHEVLGNIEMVLDTIAGLCES